MECADFQKQIYYPIFAAWLANHMKCIELFGIKSNSCPVCNVIPDQLGCFIKELKQNPIRKIKLQDYRSYTKIQVEARDCTLVSEVRVVVYKALNDLRMRRTLTVLCELPAVQLHLVYTSDLLHGIYLGLLKHLIEWIHRLLRK